ncbi:MAG: amidase family protein [Methanomassiliicoccaceae archaeon]|nr:amidase family protein [Methanomassiliicoccaceae archaeon]
MTLSLVEKYRMFSEVIESFDLERPTFSLSDDIVAKGFQATAGSGVLEGHYPVYDSSVASKMYGTGCSLIGKTNMDEFGFGKFSVTGTGGTPGNPFDPERSCGGSCGGAACAASLFEGHAALATSVEGGITAPSAFCGVYGLTPTQGRVSRCGQIDSVSSMGPIGIIASSPEIIKRYLPVISGKDVCDPVSSAQPQLELGKKKIKSAAIPRGIADDTSGAVKKAFEDSVEKLKGMSVDVEFVDMPSLKYAMSAHYVLSVTEGALNLATYCGMRVGPQDGDLSLPFDDYFTKFRSTHFGDEAKMRIIAGTYMTLGDNRKNIYLKALGTRQAVLNDHKKVLSTHDVIVTPSMPFTAPKFSDVPRSSADSYMSGCFAVPPIFCGLPCLSVPCGYDADGMPVGMQFISDHWCEDVLIDAAASWNSSFKAKRPEVSL